MKKYVIILALMVSLPLFAEHVDPETARKVATAFLNNNGAKVDQLTDLSKSTGFPNLYIFTTQNSFVIMAADNCVEPILGYSLENPFHANDMPANLRWWLDGYDERIEEINNSHEQIPAEIRQEWADVINGKFPSKSDNPSKAVTPILSTAWNQDPPFNNLCPENTVTGCVATAMAQVMKKWNYPDTGIGSHSYSYNSVTHSANFGTTTYDWANMIDSYANGYNEAQANAVATLMRHCGVSVEMKYRPGDESGSTISRACSALQTYFNYCGTYLEKRNFQNDSTWLKRLKDDLDQDMPILYAGSHENSTGGHAFVCDGYDAYNKLHFNWGWGPNQEGYYSVNTHSYTRNQVAVLNIKPDTCNAQKPTSLRCIQQNGYKISLAWDAGSNAVSYNIYRNNTLIGNTTSTSFIDQQAVLGDNVYYVRSLGENSKLSLSSNNLTVNISYQTPIVDDLTIDSPTNTPSISWSTPWWHPQTTNGIIANVEETRPELDSYIGWDNNENQFMLYWGTLYPKKELVEHHGKAIFQTTFYTLVPGNYKVLIYQGTDPETNYPQELKSVQSINTVQNGWIAIPFDEPVFIDSIQDLWVFVYDADGKLKRLPCQDIATETNHQYFGYDDGGMQRPPHEACQQLIMGSPMIWLIRTYLTDGTYTYNLYDGETKLNGNTPINGTSYNIANSISNGIHQFSVTTNYFGGESGTSNKVGLVLGSASLNSLDLGTADKMTVAKNSTLTVTGALENDNPDNLILEDSAQLINSSPGVKATVKKTIKGFQTDNNKGNWYLIASPITEQLNIADATNLKATNTADYDLYAFNQASNLEWCNYKQDHFTTIDNKTGYLYAHRYDIDIEFSGTLNNTDGSVPINYASGKPLAEYNLVGNPFPCNATIDKTDYYRIVETEEGSKIQLATTSTIAPMEGIFVKAVDDNDKTVTFSKATAKGNGISGRMITISVSRNPGNVLDNARIRLDGNLNMEKLMLRDGGTRLYILQSGIEYALVVNEDLADVPVCFNAATDGIYTLNIETSNGIEYLHLIDNLTGANIDLLTTPSYSFEAKTDDYPSRFRLLFNAIGENPSNLDDIEGDIQIMDVTGRVVTTDRNAKLTPGVYILRTVNGNDIQTKKIIIK